MNFKNSHVGHYKIFKVYWPFYVYFLDAVIKVEPSYQTAHVFFGNGHPNALLNSAKLCRGTRTLKFKGCTVKNIYSKMVVE